MERNQLLVTALVTVFFMVILDQLFEAIGLRFGWIGTNFSIGIIIWGIASSILGIFLSFRAILKTEYKNSLQTGILLGLVTSILFIIYVSFIITTYDYPIRFDYWLSRWAFGVFLSSLIGSVVGFLLGGVKLERMPPPRISVPQTARTRAVQIERGGLWLILFILVGAVIGYFAGYIVWILFGQIQIAIGIAFPYAAIFPPPLVYQIGWTILGALSFPFKILPALLD